MSQILIEVAAFTPSSAILAANSGAGRIELCSGFAEGGLSPSIGAVDMVREKITIPLHVMVRPRVGDFVYNDDELLVMEKEIIYYKQLKVDGIVLGVLNNKGEININALNQLLDVARPMSVTFHRAFDQCITPLFELEKLIKCGIDRVLTSGGKQKVPEGLQMLKQYISIAGDSLIILPGGGITVANVKEIIDTLGIQEIHMSCKKMVTSPMAKLPVSVSLCSPQEVYDFRWNEFDAKKLKEIIDN